MVYFEMVLTFQTRLVYISLGMNLEEPTNIPTHAFSVRSCLAISTTVCKTLCCINYQTKFVTFEIFMQGAFIKHQQHNTVCKPDI